MGIFSKAIKVGAGFITGGASTAGDIYSGQQSAKEAAKNRDWQKMMSDTAHQREVKDLRAAGLNPILSATGGAGASTPGGAVAQVPDYGRGANANQMLKLQKTLIAAQADQASSSAAKAEAEKTESNLRSDHLAFDLGQKEKFGDAEASTRIQGATQAISKAAHEIQNLALTGESSALDIKRKKADLKEILSDKVLQKYILSSAYGDQAFIDKLMNNPSPADVAKLMLILGPLKAR